MHCIVTAVLLALFDLGTRDAVEIPAAFTKDGIIVRVGIEGRGLDFVLDSGSPNVVLDSKVAQSLGIRSSGALTANFGGDYAVANGRAPEMTVGDLRATDVAVSTADFHRQANGHRIVGLLGSTFLESGALEVDFQNRRLVLHRSVPAGLGAAGWSALPLRLDSGVPLIEAAFNGRAGYFIADLGADDSMLYPHYFSQLHVTAPPGDRNRDTMITLAGKPFPIKHFVVKRFVLGDWIFAGAEVVVPSGPYAQEPDYDGLIGRNMLSQFDLIFDYKNRQLWFKPIDTGGK